MSHTLECVEVFPWPLIFACGSGLVVTGNYADFCLNVSRAIYS